MSGKQDAPKRQLNVSRTIQRKQAERREQAKKDYDEMTKNKPRRFE